MGQFEFINKFEKSCDTNQNKNAITYLHTDKSKTIYSYVDLKKLSKQFSNHFSKYINNGDRIVLLSPLSPFCYISYFALAYSKVTVVIINSNLPESELDYFINKSEPCGIVTTNKLYNSYAKKYEDNLLVFNIENAELFNNSSVYKSCNNIDLDATAILFSSGTTSSPKGVVISYNSMINSSDTLLNVMGTNNIKYLLTFPMFHISGFSVFLSLILGGGEIALIEDFDSTKLLNSFQDFKPNTFGMVPSVFDTFKSKIEENIKKQSKGTVILKLIRVSGVLRKHLHINIGRIVFKSINKQVFGGKLKYIPVGSGITKKETAEFFLNLGFKWINTYASTEANLPITATTHKDNYPSDSVGNVKFNKNVNIKIINKDSNNIGEIAVKSNTLMKYYFQDKDATEKVFDSDGYFLTGDLGYIKKEYLYITGRSKESIHLFNGEKISPEEIERVYKKIIPSNVIFACSGIKSNENYDKIALFIENPNVENQSLLEEIIKEFSNQQAPNYRLNRVIFVDKIPLSAIGKVQRFKLADTNEHIETKENKNTFSIYEQIENLVKIYSGIEYIQPNHKLKADLGIDSLKLLELCVKIEELYSISIYDNLSNDLSVQQLVDEIKHSKNKSNIKMEFNINDYPMKKSAFSILSLRFIMRLSRIIYKFEVKGSENLKIYDSFILCPNHQTHLDGLWVFSCLKKDKLKYICCMAKKEHLDNKVSKYFLRMLGGIPIDRYNNSLPSIKRCLDLLKSDQIVLLIHPEGTRTKDGKIGELKSGAAELSIQAKVPIIPVSINGGYQTFNTHMKRPKIFDFKNKCRYKMQFYFGKPIIPTDMTSEKITEKIKEYYQENL